MRWPMHATRAQTHRQRASHVIAALQFIATTSVMHAMVGRPSRQLKMPRPDAYVCGGRGSAASARRRLPLNEGRCPWRGSASRLLSCLANVRSRPRRPSLTSISSRKAGCRPPRSNRPTICAVQPDFIIATRSPNQDDICAVSRDTCLQGAITSRRPGIWLACPSSVTS